MSRLLGLSFATVFAFYALSVFSGSHELSAAFSIAAELVLLLYFSAVLLIGPSLKNTALLRFVLLSSAALLISALYISAPFRAFISCRQVYLTGVVIFTLVILYLLRNKTGREAWLFWAVLVLASSMFTRSYIEQSPSVYIPAILKLASYSGFLYYFYQAYPQALIKTVGENDKKLAEFERTIEYEVKKRMLKIEEVNKKLVSISKIDAMSKVLNKAAILEAVDNLIEKKPKGNFSVLMFDIDDFKAINDTFGHTAGDKCIKLLSASVRNNLRDIDIIGRFGGDEFLVVLPDTGAGQAITIAERFRKHIEASESPHYTISIGIASYPSDGTDVKTLIETADAGLYKSKQKGRNAVSHRDFY